MINYTHFVCCFTFVTKGTILIIKIKQKCIDISKISCQWKKYIEISKLKKKIFFPNGRLLHVNSLFCFYSN